MGFAVIRQVGFSWFAWLADWTKEDGLCQAAGLSGESIQRLPCSANWKRRRASLTLRRLESLRCIHTLYTRSVERPYDSVHHVGIIYNVTVSFLDLRFEQDGSTDRCEWCTENQARSLPLTAVGAFAVDLAWSAS